MPQTGLRTSSSAACSRMESSIDAAWSTFDPLSSCVTVGATSSPVSGSGPLPWSKLVGLLITEYGQEAVLASLSARQAEAAGLTTSGICGRLGSTSSTSAALQSSLENKLRARLSTLGSSLFKMTWKPWPMPSGRSRSRLRASAHRTSETDATGWGTPSSTEAGGTPEQFLARKAALEGACGVSLTALNLQAQLASWPTAAARDWKDGREQAVPINALLGRTAWLAHWPTTTTQDSASSGAFGYNGQTFMTLTDAARMASWATPTSALANKGVRSTEGGIREAMRNHGPDLAALACLVFGPLPIGSPAATADGGQLNPAHPRWLMGLPPAWDACAPTATRSSRRKPKSGSAP